MAAWGDDTTTKKLLALKKAKTKRLIVMCDGTWQDSTADALGIYPTNVTRFSRALAREGRIWDASTFKDGYLFEPTARKKRGIHVTEEQIVYYVKGVGTGVLDKYTGGAFGLGVSGHVREAYAFLASNWEEGDSIALFGFSRGAYTARSVASMIARHGLLTSVGMDDFPRFYEGYNALFNKANEADTAKEAEFLLPYLTSNPIRLRQRAANAIGIVGVWDTVSSVRPGVASFLAGLGVATEQNELFNQDLPSRVTYGFHAVALDEARTNFTPILWTQPPPSQNWCPIKLIDESPNPGVNDELNTCPTKIMKQVWFSGAHSDIGGGPKDTRLSDITLAWMIAECEKTKLLEFDHGYLLTPAALADDIAQTVAAHSPWSTARGRSVVPRNCMEAALYQIGHLACCLKPRAPLKFHNVKHEKDDGRRTHESIHMSVNSRKFSKKQEPPFAGEDMTIHKSVNLSGEKKLITVPDVGEVECWGIKTKVAGKDGWQWIKENPVNPLEYKLKDRIRHACYDFEPEP